MKVLLLGFTALLCIGFTSADKSAEEIEEKWQSIINDAVEQAQQGQLGDAITLCEKSLDMKEHYSAHHLLSQIYLAQSDHVNALKHMEKAARLEPESKALQAGVLFHKGVVAQQDADYVTAHTLFQQSAEAMPEIDVKTLEKLAIAVAALGDIPLAVKYLRDIWKLVPQYTFHNGLPFVRVADLYDEQMAQAEEEGGKDAVNQLNSELRNITKITDKAFIDISIDGGVPRRVVFGMYGLAAPRAVRNFLAMSECQNVELCYKGVRFHRIIENFIVQGGDVAKASSQTFFKPFFFFFSKPAPLPSFCCFLRSNYPRTPLSVLVDIPTTLFFACRYKVTHQLISCYYLQGDGTGVANTYGRPFADEVYSLVLMHERAGILQAANSGVDSNGGQFVVLADAAPHLNGNHVIMGKVLEGLDVILEANKVKVDAMSVPAVPVIVENCGVL